ncbi:uncharacterized protein LOC141856116 [Brevipalpus obovatus]|uniref:uncharacterized protein LOC141856116 n=1 Tax=Brevipalpus obovatus TaxID=246614 RepID=UPI003D9F750C
MGSKQGLWNILKTLTQKYMPRIIPAEKSNMLQGGDPVYKGHDLDGNSYWEYTVNGNIRRFCEPADYEKCEPFDLWDRKFTVTDVRHSSEWYGWLMNHREDPPTEEEVLKNLAIAYLKKERAQMLEAEERKNWPQLDAALKRIEAERHKINGWPTYADIELYPCQHAFNEEGLYRPDIRIEFVDSDKMELEGGNQEPESLPSGETTQTQIDHQNSEYQAIESGKQSDTRSSRNAT